MSAEWTRPACTAWPQPHSILHSFLCSEPAAWPACPLTVNLWCQAKGSEDIYCMCDLGPAWITGPANCLALVVCSLLSHRSRQLSSFQSVLATVLSFLRHPLDAHILFDQQISPNFESYYLAMVLSGLNATSSYWCLKPHVGSKAFPWPSTKEQHIVCKKHAAPSSPSSSLLLSLCYNASLHWC